MNISIADTDTEIDACYPVMRELRPHIAAGEFLSRIRYQQRSGYQLAYLEEAKEIVAVAGFRIIENLSNGRYPYIDDLVTSAAHRSKGFGAKLLSWLKEHTAEQNCLQLHLDCGIQRKDAHRFYGREAMNMVGFHFAYNITS